MKKILEQLTKITDLTILFATIFVFLAYITPEGASQDSLREARTNAQSVTASLSNAENQTAASNRRLQESTSISNDLRNSIVQLETESSSLDPTIDQARINQLNSEIDQLNTSLANSTSAVNEAQLALNSSLRNEESIRASLRSSQARLADLEAESSRAISWIQPVRNNTDRLIDAAGVDGFIAGFAALIFCLIIKRRRDWFRRMFGLYFK